MTEPPDRGPTGSVPQSAPHSAPQLDPIVDHAAAATAAHGRSLAPDLARGIMLLLIALANVPWWLAVAERGVTNAHGRGFTGGDYVYQLVSLVAIDGRIYPLFSFLFGYGIWQMYSRQAAAGAPWREVRRVLQIRHGWMVAFGAVHALLLWFGDIVGAYGLVGLLVTWLLLRRSDRALRVVAWVFAGLLGASALFSIVSGAVLSTGIAGDPSAMAAPAIEYPTGQSNYLLFMLQSFGLWALATPLQAITLTVPLSVVLGVLAARRGLLDRPREHGALLVRIAVGGIAIGWLGGALAAMQFAGLVFDPAISWATMGASSLAGVAGGIGYAALIALVAGRLGDRHGIVTRAVTAVGKRSLTSYLLQSVLFAPLLAAWGFGLGATLTPLGAAGLAVGVWFITAVVALILDLRGKRGPAEALLRHLAYGRRPVAAPTPVS
ncbi:DUF418 domain-containing protein [Agrococcus sp. ProA11]|uniref:DUF418 domain-containing protein n=1 Tax=Agrococcus chionoecetis TaxID=3153752 RepID=UPI0032604B0D